MKITKMRIKGQKPHAYQLQTIANHINTALARAGFVTECGPVTSTSLKIGQHMRSFSLDLSKHDRNLYRSQCGDKLTNLPTWDQRVEFNDIINAVLNKYKVSANITSGPYTIRKGSISMTEGDWHTQKPEWVNHNECRGNYIESVDEKQYLEDRRIERNKKARERRAQLKSNEQALANDAKRVLGLV